MSAELLIQPLFGLLAEFDSKEALIEAADKARLAGYRQMDGFSPFPVHGLDEALGLPPNRVPLLVLCGGIIGGTTGFTMQEVANVFHYPLIVGGRPFNSWPAFIPITFELTILTAALFAVVGMITMNGLPQPYHPLFNVQRFEAATRDGFFLCIESTDPQFDLVQTRQFLEGTAAVGVFEVPA